MDDRRAALITGGAKRVGRAVVERLAGTGWDVFFTYRSSDADAADLRAKITATGVRCEMISVDLSNADASLKIAAFIRQHSPKLDLLVNNASQYRPDSAAGAEELSRSLMQTNYLTPVAIVRELSPELKRARGHVINMLDILADRPMPSYSIYSASKAALLNATFALARDLAPEVTVNGISPGVVDWPDNMPLDDREAYLAKVPLRRAGTPDDVAKLVEFLATNGTYITGQNIRLDGGRSLL